MRITEYRLKYSDGKLKKLIDKCENSMDLWLLFNEWKPIAHQESREYRLINCDIVIKDINTFIRAYKKMLKTDISFMEMINLKAGLEEIEKYKAKKVRKSKGGYKAKATKDNPMVVEKWSDWYVIDTHPFSVNFQYDYVNGRKVRSKAYQNWINSFRVDQVPQQWHLWKQGVDIRKPLAISIEVVAKAELDCDNMLKSFLDMLINIWRLPHDNHIQDISIRRVGYADNYRDGKIMFSIRNI